MSRTLRLQLYLCVLQKTDTGGSFYQCLQKSPYNRNWTETERETEWDMEVKGKTDGWPYCRCSYSIQSHALLEASECEVRWDFLSVTGLISGISWLLSNLLHYLCLPLIINSWTRSALSASSVPDRMTWQHRFLSCVRPVVTQDKRNGCVTGSIYFFSRSKRRFTLYTDK